MAGKSPKIWDALKNSIISKKWLGNLKQIPPGSTGKLIDLVKHTNSQFLVEKSMIFRKIIKTWTFC